MTPPPAKDVREVFQCFRDIATRFKLSEPDGSEWYPSDGEGSDRPMFQLVHAGLPWVLTRQDPCKELIHRDRGYSMGRQNDVLIGFRAKSAGRLSLSIGPTLACTFDMVPGQFKFAYDDAYVVPFISLRFHEVRVVFTGPEYPELVQALFQTECRRAMAVNGLSCPMPSDPCRSATFRHGLFEQDGDCTDTIRLPYMRGPMHFEAFLTPAEVERLTDEACSVGDDVSTRLHPMPPGVKTLVQDAATRWFSRMRAHVTPEKEVVDVPCYRESLEIVGDKWTVGHGAGGMHEHRDESFQGGKWTMLVYLTDVAKGGETVFHDIDTTTVVPRSGTAIVFAVDALHHARPVDDGEKLFVAFEANVVRGVCSG